MNALTLPKKSAPIVLALVLSACAGIAPTPLDPTQLLAQGKAELTAAQQNVEEILATMSASTGHGGAVGDLNNDGIADAEQSAVTTIAWTTVDKFDAAVSGTLTEVKPIITVQAVATNNVADDTCFQLQDIKVLPTTGSASDGNITGGRPVGSGSETITTPWDPIQFTVAPSASSSGLQDLDPSRPGTQIRIVIDISRAGMTTSDFNAYMKYVSADTITAASAAHIALSDLDGKAITQAGWYDFTQRKDANGNYVGDGARFVLATDGKTIASIQLTLTDNAFGDDSMVVGKILDPGVPVWRTTPPASATIPAGIVVRPDTPPTPRNDAFRAPEVQPFTESPHNGVRPFDSALPTFDTPMHAKDARLIDALFGTSSSLTFGDSERIALSDLYTEGGTWHALVSRDIDANLQVFRGVGDQYADRGSEGKFIIPADAFVHSRVDATIKLDARQSDGRPLPAWVRFDAATGAFSYAVPDRTGNDVSIKLTARDSEGREAAAQFRLQIGDKRQGPSGRAGLSEQLRDATRLRSKASLPHERAASLRQAS